MARKPNYTFERNARNKAKADKKEAKRQAKLASKVQKVDGEAADDAVDESPIAAETERDPTLAPPE